MKKSIPIMVASMLLVSFLTIASIQDNVTISMYL